MPEPESTDVAAAFSALGQGVEAPPNIYVVTLQSANQLTRASRLSPRDLIRELGELEAAKGPNAWFSLWIDGDGDRVGDIRSVMYVPAERAIK